MMIGIDEVGRGCWAGPLVVAAVALDQPIAGLADSKLLSLSQREAAAREIRSFATAVSIAWVPSGIVDKVGLSRAMQIACRALHRQLSSLPADEIIIDGAINYLPRTKAQAIIKADGTIPAVSAASIIAKVARDRYMRRISELYPQYGFERHVGYGTAEHQAALELHGSCLLHRMSFQPLKPYTNI